MRDFLHMILNDHDVPKDSFWHAEAFTSFWHWFYFGLMAICIIVAAIILNKKSDMVKKKVLDILPFIVIGLYISDLFLRPIAQLEITADGDFQQSISGYLDKLPFHICTSMGVVSVFAQHSKKLSFIKGPFVILSIVGPLIYIVAPIGVFGDRFALSYNTIQTVAFHGSLMAWGILSITTGQVKVTIKNWYKTLALQGVLFFWGLLGNIVFSDMSSPQAWVDSGYDWFFLKSGAFSIAEGELWYAIVAPIGAFCAIYAVAIGVYGCAHLGYFIAKNAKRTKYPFKRKLKKTHYYNEKRGAFSISLCFIDLPY